MSICSLCGKEIVFSNGCDAKYIRIGPKVYERISSKGRKDEFEDIDETSVDMNKDASNRCMCCGAYPGKYHHPYCPINYHAHYSVMDGVCSGRLTA